ncbi:MAG: uracil-DNA glycosylase [Pseudomonadota bacterium]
MVERLNSSEREAVLEALGIDQWRLRSVAPITNAPTTDGPDDADESDRATTDTQPAEVLIESDAPVIDWSLLRHNVKRCTKCRLHETRTQAVFGVGAESAQMMVVGEAPGAEEDRRGEPFVGRAGQMLDAMLKAIGIERSTVFIANVIKCRPPQNRDPRADEVEACTDYLEAQIRHVNPDVILAVGRVAAQHLLGSTETLGRLRVQRDLHAYGVPVLVTYHPAYLLRTPVQKARAWEDLKRLRQMIGAVQ